MDNRLSDIIRLAEGKMTLERFKELHDIFEPLTDQEFFEITNSKYIYEELRSDRIYRSIYVENGNYKGLPQNTREERKDIDYANRFSIDLFKIGELQRKLQKEVQTAKLFSNVSEIEQQIEDLWNKLFGNNKPSVCSVIPRSLLVDIYQKFSSYLPDYSNANEFADAILFDNPIKCLKDTKTLFQHLIHESLTKIKEVSSDLPLSKIYTTIFPTKSKARNRSLSIEDEKKKKSYCKNKAIIDKIESYLNEFDAKKYLGK